MFKKKKKRERERERKQKCSISGKIKFYRSQHHYNPYYFQTRFFNLNPLLQKARKKIQLKAPFEDNIFQLALRNRQAENFFKKKKKYKMYTYEEAK